MTWKKNTPPKKEKLKWNQNEKEKTLQKIAYLKWNQNEMEITPKWHIKNQKIKLKRHEHETNIKWKKVKKQLK